MGLTVLTGPVASGKSRLAQRLTSTWTGPVTVIVTAEALDAEMSERIERHRRNRPAAWDLVEAPLDLESALAAVPDDAFVILDCLTLWASNQLGTGASPEQLIGMAVAAAKVTAARPSPTVAVTNEVGWGIVPMNEFARSYRDVLGRINAAFVDVADRAAVVVAGRAIPLVATGDSALLP